MGASGRKSAVDRPLDGMSGWIAPVLFASVTVLLFREFVFSDRMLVGQDTFSLGYVARAFFADALRTTGFPLWNPQILGGTPFLESLAGGDSLYPPSLLLLFLTETYRALGWKLVLHVFLAGCFMYLWIRLLGVSKGAALLSGLIYLLAPYMVTLVYPGHDGKLFVTALTPLLFAASEWMILRRGLVPGAAVGAVVGLVILTTHFQMAYFLFGAIGLYMAFRCVQIAREGEGWPAAARRFGVFLGFSVIGAGAAGIQLVPAVSYVTEHSRRTMTTMASGGDEAVAYSSSWSLHPEEAVGLVVPEFVGSNAGGAEWASSTYWGRNLFKHNHEYVGLVAVLLAMIAFMGGARGGLRWFLAMLGMVALLFALGEHTPIWRISYELLPGISLFRAPSMAIFLTGFSIATLAGLGVDRGAQMLSEEDSNAIARWLSIPVGLLAVGWLLAQLGVLPRLWTSTLSFEMSETVSGALDTALPYMTRGFLIATVLAALTCALWWAMGREYVNLPLGVALLAVLITVDEARVDDAFIQTIQFETFFGPDANTQFLIDRAREEGPFRVLSMARGGQDVAPGMHGLELAGGHHPNDLARYRELIGMAGSGLPENLSPPFHPNVLRLLNIRYVLWPDTDYGPLEQYTPTEEVAPVSRLQFSDGSIFSSVYSYPGLPRARVVGEAIVVAEDQVLDVILDPDAYDPATQVVLAADPPIELAGPGVQGAVTWVETSPNRLVFDVEASGAAIVVLADNWFPAWRAYVDGGSSPVLRADHALRAVAVTEGRHRVEFRYESDLLRTSFALSLVCTLLLVGTVGSSRVAAVRRRSREGSDPMAERR